MSEMETEITARYRAQAQDGSEVTITEQPTFLIKRPSTGSNEPPSRAPYEVEYLLDDSTSLIRDQNDKDKFRNDITGETFRRIRP